MRRRLFPLLLAFVTLGVAPRREPVRPRLLVVITVDQLRPDYLGRWPGQWSGGLGRIFTQGAYFANGLQDHAMTQTAPGHSTILSGREPAHTGIVSNDLGVPDTGVKLIGAQGDGASPHRFRGTTLVDWMRDADSGLRVLSVARKNRAAILPIGRSKSPVFWWAEGRFTTSTWYADTLPSWVTAWNGRSNLVSLAGKSWTLALADSAYREIDDQPWEHGGKNRVFPHALPADSAKLVNGLAEYPVMDSLTLDFALTGARSLQLGQRTRTDLLAVSLGSTDAIGHDYGPDSREIHDQLLRLDRWLGIFLDSLAVTVPADQIMVVLTADHGVTPFVQALQARGQPAGFISLSALVTDVNRQLGEPLLAESSGLVFADTAALRALKVNPESLATALTARVQRLPHVVDAWSAATLGAPLRTNVGAQRWRRALPRDFPFLVCAVAAPGYVWANDANSADHGTTNQDDVGVPIAFLGTGIRAGVFADTVRTVDIAPTLARLLDLKTAKKLDGTPIRRVAR